MVTKQKVDRSKNVAPVSLSDLGIDASTERNVNPAGFAVAVRVLLQNWRQGTVSCLGRGEVTSRSNKKPWKQKGTGRARAGSPRSPIWRGGGVTFGPQPRTRELSISKKMRTNVFNALLFNQLNSNNIVVLDWMLEGDTPKTSAANIALRNANLSGKKVVFFVDQNDALTRASLQNIPNVRLISFDQPNAYDLADCDGWVFMKKDFNRFKEMILPWI